MVLDGCVLAVLGGPPCETWSAARGHDLGGGRKGPRALRSPEALWGLPSLRGRERAQIALANGLLHAQFQLMYAAWSVHTPALMEHTE
eukprot:6592707-Karenia_brevis.AAC.1